MASISILKVAIIQSAIPFILWWYLSEIKWLQDFFDPGIHGPKPDRVIFLEDRLQNWFTAVEDVPANVQRYVTKMKMIDHHYELILKEIDDTEDENELARLLIRLHNLTDIKRELTSKINDHFSKSKKPSHLSWRDLWSLIRVVDDANNCSGNKFFYEVRNFSGFHVPEFKNVYFIWIE